MKPEELVIIVRGGIVQSVLSSSLEYPINVEILDYDNLIGLEEDKDELGIEEFKTLEEKIKDYFPIY